MPDIANGPRNIPQVETLGDAFARTNLRAAQLRQIQLENDAETAQIEQQRLELERQEKKVSRHNHR